jgi:RNA:NAD 2'-phosphotransferase (TPT1/KptA family)
LLEAIKNPFEFEEIVHGTTYSVVEPILKTGLNRMARNHIRKFHK